MGHAVGPTRRAVLRNSSIIAGTLLAGCTGNNGVDSNGSDGSGIGDGTDVEQGGDSTGNPTIEVTDAALFDETIELRVQNLEPGAELTFRALLRYSDDDAKEGQWESNATFEVPEDGTVTLSAQDPIDGTYNEADAMGHIWSMQPRSDLDDPAETELTDPTTNPTRWNVHLRAIVEEETVATGTTTRQTEADGVQTREPENENIVGRLFLPSGSGPHPGALVLHGGNPHLRLRASRLLASRGVAALTVKYFGPDAPSIPDKPHELPVENFEQPLSWLTDQPEVQSGGVGVFGRSLGGAGALLAGSQFDIVDAVAAVNPVAVAFGGAPMGGTTPWSIGGEPHPHLEVDPSHAETHDGLVVRGPIFDHALDEASAAAIRDATIAVEDIDGDILFVTGEVDASIDSSRVVNAAIDRIEANDFAYEYEHRTYQDAGHMINVPYRPTENADRGGNQYYGGTPAGMARANADSWPRIVDLLQNVG